MKIGIMGGTFNPIHNGHLLIGEYARTELSLDKVIYIPTGKPGHKLREDVVSGHKRYEMVNLAIKDNPYFESSSMEIDRDGITYSLDTLKELRKLFKNKADFYFIIGEDSLFNLESWKGFCELAQMCRFIVFKRKPTDDRKILEKISFLKNKYELRVSYLESPLMEISSTDIRKRVRQRKSIKYQVPRLIEDYIKEKKLYEAD